MRLIDANKLNEHKFLTPQVKVIGGRKNGKIREQLVSAYQKGWNDAIDAIIDNAPTVEPPEWQIEFLKRMYEKLRPQGKWGKWVISEIRCPDCLEYFQTDCYSMVELNKCPCCGADMKGGAE